MIQKELPPGPNTAMPSTYRRDIWPTKAASEATFRRREFFGSWEPRAFDKLVEYGLRSTPTPVYPDSKDEFTLTTTKHQEAWTFLRPNFEPQQIIDNEGSSADHIDRLLSPDLDPQTEGAYLFHRAEACSSEAKLPFLRPSVLYLFAGKSVLSPAHAQKHKMETTGTGVGGSGGSKAGQVSSVVFPKAGHLLPFEKIADCAEATSAWLGSQVRQFKADEALLESHPSGKSERDMLVVSEKWRRLVREPAAAQRPRREKL
ncbi:hypothetical protein MMC30_007372 [Trapelia coarctata]|nr:hypothetical protein [Trapelia coarctata]